MRIWIALVIAACGGAATKPPPPEIAIPSPPAPPAAPTVTVASALVGDEGTAPPVVVILDANGKRSIASATTWANLAAGIYESGPTPGDDRAMKVLKAGFLAQKSPKSIVDDLATDVVVNDPPPDAAWEIDEDQGVAFVDFSPNMPENPPKCSWRMGTFAIPAREDGDPMPPREASIVGVIGGPLDRQPAVVVASPTGKAGDLVKAITETEGMIGVAHAGTIRRLRLQFVRVRDALPEGRFPRRVEVRFTTSGLEIETVPEVPTVLGWTGGAMPADFNASLAKKRDAKHHVDVDVLVAPDTDVQRLVDVLVGLDAAEVRMIGLGIAPAPGSPGAKARGHRYPMLRFHPMRRNGDLDKESIHKNVVVHRDAILTCLVKAHTGKGPLRLELEVELLIEANGELGYLKARGKESSDRVEPALAKCLTEAVKPSMRFPKPKGGGGVQVIYPLTFRQ